MQASILARLPAGSQRRAAFLSCGSEGAGDWLRANTAFRWARLADNLFSRAASLRLSLPMPMPGGDHLLPVHVCNGSYMSRNEKKGGSKAHPVRVPCTYASATSTGWHAFGCSCSKGLGEDRHDAARDALIDAVKEHSSGASGYTVFSEPHPTLHGFPLRPNLSPADLVASTAHNSRADVLLINNADGSRLFLDVVVTHPNARTTVGVTTTALFAATAAYKGKNAKYGRIWGSNGANGAILPPPTSGHNAVRHMAFESYGATHPATAETLKDIAHGLYPGDALDPTDEDDPGYRRALFIRRTKERIGIAIQRHNAYILGQWLDRGAARCDRSGSAGWWLSPPGIPLGVAVPVGAVAAAPPPAAVVPGAGALQQA